LRLDAVPAEVRKLQEVDHITPLSEGGDPYRLEGLQGICSPCHWAKTAREGGKGKGRVAQHGAYS
jgi:5-methylcytosine-specific restriction endonuclease McrA